MLYKAVLVYDPAIPLLDIYTQIKTQFKTYMHPMFIAAVFTRAITWKQSKCPSADEWIKTWYAYKMEYYSAIKREELGHL